MKKERQGKWRCLTFLFVLSCLCGKAFSKIYFPVDKLNEPDFVTDEYSVTNGEVTFLDDS